MSLTGVRQLDAIRDGLQALARTLWAREVNENGPGHDQFPTWAREHWGAGKTWEDLSYDQALDSVIQLLSYRNGSLDMEVIEAIYGW